MGITLFTLIASLIVLFTPALILALQANLTNNLPDLHYRTAFSDETRHSSGFYRVLWYSRKLFVYSIRQITNRGGS